MESTCWDRRAKDSIIKSGQKDTEASIPFILFVTRQILVTLAYFYKLLYQYHKTLASSFSLNIECSQYFVVLMQ